MMVKEEQAKNEMKAEAVPVNLDLSIGDMPTMDEDGFQPIANVDRYQILRELGAGGFGTVFLAKDTVAGVQVALKALPPEISAIPGELESVRENFVLVSKLVHQNIAGLLHLHKVENADAAAQKLLRITNRGYLVVMEYIPGSELGNWKKQFNNRKVPFDQAVNICAQVAAALDYAHENNIIHRDIKPSNVMISSDEKVKVMDFGLAAEVRSSMSRVSQEKFDTSGTRPYMAPEQWGGKEQRAATDQYALAVMFYEMIYGRVPFQSVFETGDAVLMMNVVEQKQPETIPELDKKQNAVLMQALSKKPEERFASCGDFIRAISGGKVKTKKVKVEKSASNTKKILAAIILIALLGGGVWYGIDAYNGQVRLPAGLADVSPIRSEAEVIWESARKLNDADGFKQDMTQIKIMLRTADTLFEKDDYGSALKRYQEVISRCKALQKLDLERSAAKIAKTGTSDTKRSADRVDASQDAKALYKNAERLSRDAADAMAKRDFANAVKLYASAKDYYAKAKTYAQGYQSAIPLKNLYEEQLKTISSSSMKKYGGAAWSRVSLAAMQAEGALNHGEWRTAVDAYEKALRDLPEAISNARGGAELVRKKQLETKFHSLLADGNSELKKENRNKAESIFKEALNIPGYGSNNEAVKGLLQSWGLYEKLQNVSQTVLITPLNDCLEKLHKEEVRYHYLCDRSIVSLKQYKDIQQKKSVLSGILSLLISKSKSNLLIEEFSPNELNKIRNTLNNSRIADNDPLFRYCNNLTPLFDGVAKPDFQQKLKESTDACKKAEKEYERMRSLLDKKVVSERSHDMALTEYKLLKTQVFITNLLLVKNCLIHGKFDDAHKYLEDICRITPVDGKPGTVNTKNRREDDDKETEVYDGSKGYFFVIRGDGEKIDAVKMSDGPLPEKYKGWVQFHIKPDVNNNKCYVSLDGVSGKIDIVPALGLHEIFKIKSSDKNIPVKDVIIIEVNKKWIADGDTPEIKLSVNLFAISVESGKFGYYNESLGTVLQSSASYFVFSPYCPQTVYKLSATDVGKIYEGGLTLTLPFRSNAKNSNPLVKASFKVLDAQNGESIKASIIYEEGLRYPPRKGFVYDGKNPTTIILNRKDTIRITSKGYESARYSMLKNGVNVCKLEPLYETYKVKIITRRGMPWSDREIKTTVKLDSGETASSSFFKTNSDGEVTFKIKKIYLEDARGLKLVPKDKYFSLVLTASKNKDIPLYTALASKNNIVLKGKVASSTLKAIAGADVKVYIQDKFVKETKTDSEGNYSIPVSDYKAGQKLTVKAGHPDYQPSMPETMFNFDESIPVTFTLKHK